jgi:AhpD family alkylhydroperoxidase
MKPRIDTGAVAPEALKGMLATEAYLAGSPLGKPLLHLLKLRASQMNGCAYCVDMHWKDARAAGEGEQRLYGLDAWREAPYYTDRERAALQWVEALTFVADGHAPDAAFDALKAHFSEREIVDLTLLAAQINAWNRLAIATRIEPGSYQPQHR